MKMKVEHNVPLSADALAIIEGMHRLPGNPYVFPGHVEKRGLSNMALLQLLKRMKVDVTAHGFRSTFRDWTAERTAFPRMVPELCLAHGPKDKTEAAYLRASLMEQRRQLLEQWAAFCNVVEADQNNVQPIRGAS
jgi:integrase